MFIIMSFYLFLLNIMSWTLAIILLIFNKKIMIEWNILLLNSMKINYMIFIDWMSLMFISTVFLISSLVIIYSMDYMNNDMNIKRFMMLIIIFVSSMIFMIISPNLISIMLGWDGLGLSSYCLVAYYQNKKSFNSSMITILMNRIGDIMIILSISLMIKFGSWDLLYCNDNINLTILFLITTAAMTKSAQIPFSTWLPLAMAAPTPISSLVHSSTLVTAGVYILIRFNYVMNFNFLNFLLILSCMTMLMAGSSAIMEFDLKKIIALSTLSQLGLMILSISFKYPSLAFFHMIAHAMFKSLLFLCSGIIIHTHFNHQDIRFISLMNMNMPFINLTFNIASLTLCGMPFLTGFYSKDMIIETLLMNNKFNNLLIFILMFISMSLTMIYSLRMMMYISLKNMKINSLNFYKSWNNMNYSIMILLFMSMFYGSNLNWILFSSMNYIFLPKNLKIMIFYFMVLGLLMSLMYKTKFNKNFYLILIFLNKMWFLPLLFNKNKNNLMKINNKIIMSSDLKWMEYLSSKKLLYFFMLMKEFKLINKLNFMIIFILSFIILLIMNM